MMRTSAGGASNAPLKDDASRDERIGNERSLIRSTTRVWPQEIVIHTARVYEYSNLNNCNYLL